MISMRVYANLTLNIWPIHAQYCGCPMWQEHAVSINTTVIMKYVWISEGQWPDVTAARNLVKSSQPGFPSTLKS